MNKFDFFLSYSRDVSQLLINSFVQCCDHCNIKIWRDIDFITAGSSIVSTFDEILGNIKNTYGAIVLLDETYLEKTWCKKELSFFLQNKVNMYLFCYNYPLENIFLKEAALASFNIVCVNEEDLTNGYLITATILMHFFITQPKINLDINKIYQKDKCLYEIWQDFCASCDYTSGIIKAHAISDWILYNIFHRTVICKINNPINKNAFVKNANLPGIIKIIFAYLDLEYNALFNNSKQISRQEYICVHQCTMFLIDWFLI